MAFFALAIGPTSALAQTPPGLSFSSQARAEQVGPNHFRLSGNVRRALEREQLKFAADQIDYYTDTRRLIATGHVVVITPGSHISADKADLDTRNRTGIYYNAFGNPRRSLAPTARCSADRSHRVFLRRNDRTHRPRHLQDHARRIHHVRAADAPLGSGSDVDGDDEKSIRTRC